MHEANARDKAQGFENIFGANGSERLGNKVCLYYFNKSNIVGSDLKEYVQFNLESIFGE